MQSPLSNFLLRPRTARHRHRRSSSSPPSLLALPLSPTSSSASAPNVQGDTAITNAFTDQPYAASSNKHHLIVENRPPGLDNHSPGVDVAASTIAITDQRYASGNELHRIADNYSPGMPGVSSVNSKDKPCVPISVDSTSASDEEFSALSLHMQNFSFRSGANLPGTPMSHRCSSESPFPSPYSLNVPLSTSGAYLCTLTLSNHASSLFFFAGLLYTGLESGDIVVFKTPKLPECARFGIGSLPVKALLVTDNTIISAHKDHKIRIWHRPDADGVPYKLLRTLPTATDYLRNLVLSKRYIQIRRHHTRLWIQHVDTITAMAVDNTSMLLYSASWDKTFKVWNLCNKRCVQSVKAHDDAINDILVSSSDGLIYTASADSTIKVWKKLSARKVVPVATLGGHGASVNTMVMKADSGILYTGGSDCFINVWQRKAGNRVGWKLATTLRGHRLPVLCLAAAGSLVSSGGADKMIRVWRKAGLGSYTCLAILQGHNGPVKSVAIAVSTFRSCFVYSTSLDRTTKVWSVLFEKEEHDQNSNLTSV